MKNETKTVGEASLELQAKNDSHDSVELQKAVHEGSNSERTYEEEVWECIQRGKKDEAITGDFYIVVLFKKERHLKNVVRQFFFYRQSCPTPEYDQTVYLYLREADKPEYLWTVPNNSACQFLPANKKQLPDDQQLLVSMAEAFNTGKLDALSAKLNKELVI